MVKNGAHKRLRDCASEAAQPFAQRGGHHLPGEVEHVLELRLGLGEDPLQLGAPSRGEGLRERFVARGPGHLEQRGAQATQNCATKSSTVTLTIPLTTGTKTEFLVKSTRSTTAKLHVAVPSELGCGGAAKTGTNPVT